MDQGGLKPDGYLPRIADIGVSRLLDEFGSVEIVGPMWCGKTWVSLVRLERDQDRPRGRTLACPSGPNDSTCGGEAACNR